MYKAYLNSTGDYATFLENDHYMNLSRKLCLLLGGDLSIAKTIHGRFCFAAEFSCETRLSLRNLRPRSAATADRKIILVNLHPDLMSGLLVHLEEMGLL